MSTNITELLYNFAMNFFIKAPTLFSSAYIFIKTTNIKCSKSKLALLLTAFFVVNIISSVVLLFDNSLGFLASCILFIVTITLFTKNNIKNTVSISIVSMGLSYCVRFIIALIIAIASHYISLVTYDFLNPKSIFTAIFIGIIHLLSTFYIMKIKRLKNGLSFFNNSDNFGIGLLISGFIFLIIALLAQDGDDYKSIFIYMFIGLIICCIGAVIWIRTNITRYYKSRLQQKADEHFNSVIAEKDSNIEELTKSNAFLSKIVHRDNHLMSSLQYSLEELYNCNDKQKESKIITELLTLTKERNELVQKEQAENKVLASTGNSVIDGALLNMYIKASAHEINFDLIANTDINYLINHFLSQTELETLLCDHIKDAVIAVESTGKRNGNILTSVSSVDGIYEISVSDNGIEFETDTLQKLGTERVTTHKESGGNGIGFMTTFDTLKNSKASLIITEYEPDKPFTKTVTFRFDGQGNFIIRSYRCEILKEKIIREDILITYN